MDQIKEGQKQVSEMIKLRAEIEGCKKPEFQIRDDGVIVRGSRMCHTPDPSPTRLANPNQFRGAKPYAGTPHYFFFFFSELTLSVVYK